MIGFSPAERTFVKNWNRTRLSWLLLISFSASSWLQSLRKTYFHICSVNYIRNFACKFWCNILNHDLPFCADCWHCMKVLQNCCLNNVMNFYSPRQAISSRSFNADSFIYLAEESFRERISHFAFCSKRLEQSKMDATSD